MRIESWEELDKIIDFAMQKNICIIQSSFGLGKSFTVDNKINLTDKEVITFNGRCSAFGLYYSLYHHPQAIAVIRDIELLLYDRTAINVLLQVTESKPVKEVCWTSDRTIADENISSNFLSQNTVIIELNNIDYLKKRCQNLLNRCFLVEFVPKRSAILDKLNQIKDLYPNGKQVYTLLEKYCRYAGRFDLRLLYEGDKLASDWGIGWEDKFIQEMRCSPKIIEVVNLLEKYDSDAERIENFSGSERSFYYLKKTAKLQDFHENP